MTEENENVEEKEIQQPSPMLNKFARQQRLNPKYVPNLIVTLAEYQFKTSFVANQEINLTAFLVEVMSNCFDP